jgi:hypothetical protein
MPGQILAYYTKKAGARKEALREDVMRALAILRDNGLDGLKAASKSGAALPAVAAALLIPSSED